MSDEVPARTVFHPVQTRQAPKRMPESVVLAAYEVYCHVYGEQPAMIDVAKGCRGGFSVGELIAFLYARSFPKDQWSRRVDEALQRGQHHEGAYTDRFSTTRYSVLRMFGYIG